MKGLTSVNIALGAVTRKTKNMWVDFFNSSAKKAERVKNGAKFEVKTQSKFLYGSMNLSNEMLRLDSAAKFLNVKR